MRFWLSLGLLATTFALGSAAPISHSEIQAKTSQGLRLLSLEDGADPVWKSEDEKLELMRAETQFVRSVAVY